MAVPRALATEIRYRSCYQQGQLLLFRQKKQAMHSYIPAQVNSSLRDLKLTDEILYWWPWIARLQNKSVFLFLRASWGANGGYPNAPPTGYDYYITHGDSYMFGWPEHLSQQVSGQIIHLTGSIMPDSFDTDQIRYVSYNNIHQRINRIPQISPWVKDIKYKASALTNRVSQSKAIVFAALKHYLGHDCVASLHHNHFATKNTHNWQPTGNKSCDDFLAMFQESWSHVKLQLPEDDGVEGSYNNTAYRQSALNFTQESYHYSWTMQNGRSFCRPGPFITEKTWKSLLSSTAFISVGQCYVYHWLKTLGLKFDYGDLDLSFDSDPGNLTRLEKIVSLIESLQSWSAQDLYEMTKSSTEFNAEYVRSLDFWNLCETTNATVNQLLESL